MSLSHILCALSCDATSVGIVSLPSASSACAVPFDMTTPIQKEACVASGAALILTAVLLLGFFYLFVAGLDRLLAQLKRVELGFGGDEKIEKSSVGKYEVESESQAISERDATAPKSMEMDPVNTTRRWLTESVDIDVLVLSSLRMILDIRRHLLPVEERPQKKGTAAIVDRLEAVLNSPINTEDKQEQVAPPLEKLDENTSWESIAELDRTALLELAVVLSKTVVELQAENAAKKEKLDCIGKILGYGSDVEDFENVSWGTESVAS